MYAKLKPVRRKKTNTNGRSPFIGSTDTPHEKPGQRYAVTRKSVTQWVSDGYTLDGNPPHARDADRTPQHRVSPSIKPGKRFMRRCSKDSRIKGDIQGFRQSTSYKPIETENVIDNQEVSHMTRNEARDYIKDRLESYLQGKQIDTRKNFNCLNPEHRDNNPSMRYDRERQKAHCFSCGVDYDTLDLIGIDYRLEGNNLFLKAFELYGLTVENDYTKEEQQTKYNVNIKGNTGAIDNMPYYQTCHSRIKDTDYPQRRGLREEVISRFMLGYDAQYGTGGAVWKALIIPTGKGSYVARNTDENADTKDRYRKSGSSETFNKKILGTAQKPIFVVEGELDALSIITAGGEAVALGSTANAQGFIKHIEEHKPTQPLIIALDNDENGEKTADKLVKGIEPLNIPFYRLNPYGEYKDANAALMGDREALAAAIKSTEHGEDKALEAEREAYKQTNTANYLQEFVNGIADSVNTPYIPTGFDNLDTMLDGGLYEGLYTVGAISSLGKTTFVLQIADQIAQSGQDVLIFSLEMARNELISKSISRHTILSVLQSGGNVDNATTSRGITTGKRYADYSETKKELINSSIREYRAYAENIYISEGIGNIGVDEIRETVRKHVLYTEKRPVVVIDYLQILSPYREGTTDKQNTDKAVIELKRISRDCKIPVLVISSFNRENYTLPISMAAFKESGAVEYSSDVLIGLQLEGQGEDGFDVDAAKRENPRQVELVLLKNRNGETGLKIFFDYRTWFNCFKEKRGIAKHRGPIYKAKNGMKEYRLKFREKEATIQNEERQQKSSIPLRKVNE